MRKDTIHTVKFTIILHRFCILGNSNFFVDSKLRYENILTFVLKAYFGAIFSLSVPNLRLLACVSSVFRPGHGGLGKWGQKGMMRKEGRGVLPESPAAALVFPYVFTVCIIFKTPPS